MEQIGVNNTEQQEAFDIQEYMTKGFEGVAADAIKATLKNPEI